MGNSERENLYNVPITGLGLSQNAVDQLTYVGIVNVGEILELLERGNYATVSVPPALNRLLFTEIKPKLEELGYIQGD